MNRIRITKDTFINRNLKKSLTIIHLADIHFNKLTKYEKLSKIASKIATISPDYCIITGDTIDNVSITKDDKKIKELLSFLRTIGQNSKVILSIGNHDIFLQSDYTFFKKLNEIKNIYVLNNESYQDDNLYIVGLTLPMNYYYNISKKESIEILNEHLANNSHLLKHLPQNKPKICLIHSPRKLTEQSALTRLQEFDFILCGHMHNGLVPDFLNKIIKNNRGLVAPQVKFFPNNARGKIVKNIGTHQINIIINGGVTKLSEYSTKFLHYFNFFYDISLNQIDITKAKITYNKK